MPEASKRVKIFPWSKEVPRHEDFGVRRHKLPMDDPNYLSHLHSHQGFVEIFWVEQGEGTHYVNGKNIPLKSNDLVMVREKDVHTFQSKSRQLTWVNLTISTSMMESLRQRYFADSKNYFPKQGAMPLRKTLSPSLRQWLDEQGPALALGGRKKFDVEAFLLPLFHQLYFPSSTVRLESCPDWLHNAYDLIRDPKHSVLGIREFERLCGRSQEHVTRITRKWLGTTPLAIVNGARLEHAAKKISETNKKISNIAQDCGFTNLASFYRLFQKNTKCRPGATGSKNKSASSLIFQIKR